MVRGSIENDRSKRFRRLSRVLNQFRELDASTRERATELLRQLSSQSDAALNAAALPWLTSPPEIQPTVTDEVDELSYDLEGLSLDEFVGPYTNYSWQDEQDALFLLAKEAVKCLSGTDPSQLAIPSSVGQSGTLADTATRDGNAPTQPALPPLSIPGDAKAKQLNVTVYSSRRNLDPSKHDDPMEQVSDDVPSLLASLYLDYRRSKSNLSALPNLMTSVITTPLGAEEDVQSDVVMTKAQLQLTVEEGYFWEDFLADAQAPELALATLSRKSTMMYDSYRRRTNTPTARNYEECREIIQAMGIPCVDSAGVEAEALASSLVLRGFADYVASEDTVRTYLPPAFTL